LTFKGRLPVAPSTAVALMTATASPLGSAARQGLNALPANAIAARATALTNMMSAPALKPPGAHTSECRRLVHGPTAPLTAPIEGPARRVPILLDESIDVGLTN
jgi:hypothetical protein